MTGRCVAVILRRLRPRPILREHSSPLPSSCATFSCRHVFKCKSPPPLPTTVPLGRRFTPPSLIQRRENDSGSDSVGSSFQVLLRGGHVVPHWRDPSLSGRTGRSLVRMERGVGGGSSSLPPAGSLYRRLRDNYLSCVCVNKIIRPARSDFCPRC